MCLRLTFGRGQRIIDYVILWSTVFVVSVFVCVCVSRVEAQTATTDNVLCDSVVNCVCFLCLCVCVCVCLCV